LIAALSFGVVLKRHERKATNLFDLAFTPIMARSERYHAELLFLTQKTVGGMIVG